MDSIGRLREELPREVNLDKEIQSSFRSAALSLTVLLKTARRSTNKAFLAGKREALADVLQFLQAGLDQPTATTAHSTPSAPNGSLNTERFINYICARQETLKAEEEAEAEEEESNHQQPLPRPSSSSTPGHFSTRSTHSHVPHSRPATAPPSGTSTHSATLPRRQEAPPPSSSAPNSPQASTYLASNLSFSSTPPATSSPSTVIPLFAAAPLASHTTSNTTTTRLQARREREHHHRSTRPTTIKPLAGSNPIMVGPSSSSPVSMSIGGVGEGGLVLGSTLKRRWNTTPALIELENLHHEDEGLEDDSVEGEEGQDGENNVAEGIDKAKGEDDVMMEMDGWDGMGERPLKRTTRRP